jgi:hypothetical protein
MRAVNLPRKLVSPSSAIVMMSVLIGIVAAIASVRSVSVLPPNLEPRQLTQAGATTYAMVDLPTSELTNRRVSWEYFGATSARADLLAHVLVSETGMPYVADRAGLTQDQIAAVAPVTAGVDSALTEPGSEQRATEVLLADRPYRLEVLARPHAPLIDVFAQAPSPAEAERLATAAIDGLRDYLVALEDDLGGGSGEQVQVTQLGRPVGTVLNPGASKKIAGLTFLVAFSIAWGLLFLLRRFAARRRARQGAGGTDAAPQKTASATAAVGLAAAAEAPQRLRWSSPFGGAAALPRPAPRISVARPALASAGGDWPHTSRALPWLLAAFMAVLWLVPFDSIQLNFSTPVDLKFDRLVLPVVFGVWALTLILGGFGAPRLRLTWVHLAVAAFVALAGLSVVLDAVALNRGLELDSSLKKLPLLIAYLSIFVMVASVVRRSEVRPFLIYTLVLSVICAVGMIWEYRTQYNLFFDWSSKLLPGVFDVTVVQSGYDFGGRRTTHGPAVHGLVAVAMLAMAMPIALVGLMHAKQWRQRILYGLAAALLFGAVMATQRKTAIVAPLAGVLTLAYFRRRELLKLAPVALVLMIAVHIASPGTTQPVINQFRPDKLGANTVSDRASDYDAIRPDVWTHLLTGRGYGSYQPVGHRILDSEVLVRTVEMGVLGLIAFVMLTVSVIVITRRVIASRDARLAPHALAVASAAVTFLVLAALFDTMSFPQVPYIFLCLAALAAALVKPPDDQAG